MAEKKGLGLRQTKGSFQVRGIVSGTDKDRFYKEGNFERSGKKIGYRSINFGVQYDENSTLYINLMGNERDNVYFCKSEKVGDKRVTNTKKVAWVNRFDQQEEGYRLIGITTGITKTINEEGKEVNKRHTLVEYDAAKDISDNLKDGMSVFISGDIAYSTYQDEHKTNFNLKNVSLCKSDIDFADENYNVENKFKQEIIFMGITPNKESKEEEFIVSAKIVTYKTVEDIELYITDKALAQQFKRSLKPYTLIEVGGRIISETETEAVDTSSWGAGIEMNKVSAPIQRKLVINGAEPTTIDTETYTEDIIDTAIAKMKAESKAKEEFGTTNNSTSEWGSSLDSDDFDGEEW